MLPFCEVRHDFLVLTLNLGVVGVKAEGCKHPLLRLCMAGEKEGQKKQVNSKREGPASEAGCTIAGHQS